MWDANRIRAKVLTQITPRRPAPVRLRLEPLDDRIVPAVTPTLLGDGTLDIVFDADSDTATVTGTGSAVRVDDGSTVTTFSAGAVRGITARGIGGDDQAVTFTGTVGLVGNLAASQLDAVTFTAADYRAAAVTVAATGAVTVDRSELTATGGVVLTSAVAVTQPTEGLLGVTAAADSRVTVTDSTISGGSVTFEAVSTVAATAAGDNKDDAARDLARVRVDSTAQVVLDGSTRVTSPGAVTITARSTTATTATALAKAGSGGSTDAAVALAAVNTQAVARVAGDTTITAGGAFNLLAANDATVTATADGTAGGAGAKGGTVAIAELDAVTTASVEGEADVSAATVSVAATADTPVVSLAKSTSGGSEGNDADTKQRLEESKAETSDGKVGVAGAFALSSLKRLETTATIATRGTVAAESVRLEADSAGGSAATADGTQTGEGGAPAVGVGVAVAINRGRRVTRSTLGGDSRIEARTADVVATTDAGDVFRAAATSGAGAKNVGVAGALAINAVGGATEAVIPAGANVDLGGADLTLSAAQTTTDQAESLPAAGGATGDKLGIGASVAINTASHTTTAEVADGAALAGAVDLTLSATGTHTTTTDAKGGGGAEGVAVTPVVALTVADNRTLARVGNNLIDPTKTAGDLTLTATHTADVTTTAEGGAQADQVAVGTVFALNFVEDHAEALVGTASVDGNLTADAVSDADTTATAKASARGGNPNQGGTVDGQVEKERQQADQASGKANPTAPSAKTADGAVTVAGAVAVNLAKAVTRAAVEDGGSLTAGGVVTLRAVHDTDSTASADGSAADGGVGIGAAVAINRGDAVTEALVGVAAKVEAAGLTLESTTPPPDGRAAEQSRSTATAISGAGAKNVGVAGALALDLTDTAATAAVGSSAAVTLRGGALTLNAASRSDHSTTATSKASGSPNVGVGASVAITTVGNTTRAAIEKGAAVARAQDVSVTSTGIHSQSASVQAGSAGTVSVTPAVALVVGASQTTAAVESGSKLDVGNDLAVRAVHDASSTTSARADAAGSNVGVGAAVGLTIADDTAAARLARDVAAAGDILVSAESDADATSTSQAGSKGGSSGGGSEADKQRQAGQQTRSTTAGGTNVSDNVNNASTQASNQTNSQAGVGTGGVGVAAAVGATVVRSETTADVAAGATVAAAGRVTVQTLADADAKAEAKGTTSGSATGVGAALAVNVVSVTNTASVGAGGTVRGQGVTVSAGRPDAEFHSLNADALAGGGAKTTGVVGAFGVNVLAAATKSFAADGATLDAIGDVTVRADEETRLKNRALGGGAGGTTGIGGGVAVNVASATTEAFLGRDAKSDARTGTRIEAASGLRPSGDTGVDRFLSLAGGGAGAGGTAVAGSVSVNVLTETTRAFLDQGAKVNQAVGLTDPKQDVDVTATSDTKVVGAAGAAAGSLATGVGAAVDVGVLVKTTEAFVGTGAKILAAGDVAVAATADETLSSATAAASGAAGTGVAGSVSVLVPVTTTRASVGNGASVQALRTVTVKADHDAAFTTVAGSAAGGGGAGVAGSVSIIVTKDTVDAFIGDADVTAGGTVTVEAVSTEDVNAVSAGGAGAGGSGVAGAAVVTTLGETTTAHLDEGATVTAASSTGDPGVVVRSADTTTVLGVAGVGAGGGAVGAGAGADAMVVTKSTDAWIAPAVAVTADGNVEVRADSDETITALAAALAGGGSAGIAGGVGAVVLNATTRAILGATPTTRGTPPVPATIRAGGSAVVAADDATEIDVIAGNAAGGGAAAFGASAAVPVVTKRTEATVGAGTTVDAAGTFPGPAVNTGAFDVAFQAFPAGNQVRLAVPADADADGNGTDDLTDPGLGQRRVVTPRTASVAGVAVTATSRDDVAVLSVGGSGAGAAALQVGAGVSVVNATTRATIGTGAKVNADSSLPAAPGQSVLVAAGSDVAVLGVGGLGAGAGVVGVTPVGEVTTLRTVTEAIVGNGAVVTARDDVTVAATATEDVLLVATAAAGAGVAGVAGSANVLSLDAFTRANIGSGAAVRADDTVRVAARDDTDVDLIAGSVGGGGVAGVGAGVGVATLKKRTEAFISNTATVDGRGLQPPGSTGRDARGVFVAASASEDVLNVAAAGAGAGLIAVGGGVAVTVLDSDVAARVDSNAKVNTLPGADADQSVGVTADGFTNVFSVGGGAAGGLGAAAGGIDVGTVRNDATASVGDGADVRAARDVTVAADADRRVTSFGLSAAGGLVGVNGSVSVWSVGTTFSAQYDNQPEPGSASLSRNALDDESGTSDERFADRFAGKQAELARTRVVDLLAGYESNSVTAGKVSAGAAQAGAGITGPSSADVTGSLSEGAAAGTTAVLAAGSKVTAGRNVSVTAGDRVSAFGQAGAVTVGLGAAVGAAVGVLNLGGTTEASVGGTVQAGGTVTVRAETPQATGDVFSVAGAGGGFVGIGAAVAVVKDQTDRRAFLAPTADVVTAQSVTVEALDPFRSLEATTGQVAGGLVAGGAAFARITSGGKTEAFVDVDARVGPAVGTLTVNADVGVDADADAVAVTAGLFKIGADKFVPSNFTRVDVAPVASAEVRSGATVNAATDVLLTADVDATADARTTGASISANSAGVSMASATAAPEALARIDNATVTAGRDVKLTADATSDAIADADASAGAAIGSIGSRANAEAAPKATATIRSAGESPTFAQVAAGRDVIVSAGTAADADADADNSTAQAFGSGQADADARVSMSTTAEVGGGSVVVVTAGRNVEVLAESDQDAEATAEAISGEAFPDPDAFADAVIFFDTHAEADANAVVTAGETVRFRATSDQTSARTPATSADGRALFGFLGGGSGKAVAHSLVGAEFDGGTLVVLPAQAGVTVAGSADLVGKRVELGATVQLAEAKSDADAVATGALASPKATAVSELHTQARVRLLVGAEVTGTEAVVFTADQVSLRTSSDARGTDNGAPVNVQITSRVAQDALSLIDAGDGARVTTRDLTAAVTAVPTQHSAVATRNNGSKDIPFPVDDDAMTPVRRITWNADAVILSAPDVVVTVDAAGTVTQADGAAVTLADVPTPQVVVGTIANPGNPEPIHFTANKVPGFGNTTKGVIEGINGKVTYVHTLDRVTIRNASARDLVVGTIDPISTVEPTAVIDVEQVPLQFDVFYDYRPTAILIDNAGPAGASDVFLDGITGNPIGSTHVLNPRGDITATGRNSMLTSELVLQAAGDIGADDGRMKVDVVRSAGAPDDVLVSARGDVALQLKARQRQAQPAVVAIDQMSAGGNLDLLLAGGVRQDQIPLGVFLHSFVDEVVPDKTTTVQSHFRPFVEELIQDPPLGVFGTGSQPADTTYRFAGTTAGGNLTVAADGTVTAELAGAIGVAGTVVKRGAGTAILTGNSPAFTGSLRVEEGTFLVNGSVPAGTARPAGGVLGGTGTVGGIVSQAGGTPLLSPGLPGQPGLLTVDGGVILGSNATYVVQLAGTGFGTTHDALDVRGTVRLGSPVLQVSQSFTSAVGTPFTIIRNDGTDAVVGTFAGLAEGSVFLVGLRRFQITYRGGDGNDVVVTHVNSPSAFAGRTVTSPIDENGVVTLTGRIVENDPLDSFKLVINWGDGTVETHTFAPGTGTVSLQHRYLDNPAGGQSKYAIDLDWRDPHGGGNADQLFAVVNNVAPTAGVAGPGAGVRNEPLTFTLTAADPSPVDQAAGFRFEIDWGDGRTEVVNGPSGVRAAHEYTGLGTFTVRVVAVDKDGGRSAPASHAVTVSAVRFAGGVLSVGGTSKTDDIVFRPADPLGRVRVLVNGSDLGTFLPTAGVRAFGGDGNDLIRVEAPGQGKAALAVPVTFDGGNGNDTLDAAGAAGGAVLLGRAGNDKLYGGIGRDVLIGGEGHDKLSAAGGEDVLIGGGTVHDNDPAALAAIHAEWRRTDVTRAEREAHLLGTAAGGVNGGFVLLGALVDDDDKDDLFGDVGLDWVFVQPKDKVHGRE